MSTLLEAIGFVLETHFGFEFPNRSPIGDSLRTATGFLKCHFDFLFLCKQIKK